MAVTTDSNVQKVFDIPVTLRPLEGGKQAVNAKICGVNAGLFQVRSSTPFEAGQDLEVLREGRVVHSRVIECRKGEAGDYHLQVALAVDTCRRSEPRFPADLPVKLYIVGSPAVIHGRVVDVSQSGLGLLLPCPVPAGSTGHLDLDYGHAVGEIRYCGQQGDQYRAGVLIKRFTSKAGAFPPPQMQPGQTPNVPALLRSIEERQLKYEALLFSLALRLNNSDQS